MPEPKLWHALVALAAGWVAAIITVLLLTALISLTCPSAVW